jgi:hypothetical protein
MADEGLLGRLRKQTAAIESRHAPSSQRDLDRVFTYLNEQLESHHLDGQVVSVLTRTDRGEIACYGQRIPADNIYRALNMNIGARGPERTSPPGTPPEEFVEHGPLAQRISYRGLQRLTSFEEGWLVPLTGPGDKYAALVNIEVDFGDGAHDVVAYQFPRSD